MLNDELSDLAIFAAVADARSFTRAAARLGKSQSALSQSVRRLEARLKLRLLKRTTRSVMPTPAREQLLSTLWARLRLSVWRSGTSRTDFSEVFGPQVAVGLSFGLQYWL
jgi:DNA-binding transcriptional LysR family regulator